MKVADRSRAYRLYRSYKTTSLEYRRLADDEGLTIGQLNGRMWELRHAREAARRSALTSSGQHE